MADLGSRFLHPGESRDPGVRGKASQAKGEVPASAGTTGKENT